jgi:hypothetical protein
MKILLLLLLCAETMNVTAQEDPDSRFPPVTQMMLSAKSYAIDSSTPAVVLAEYGITKINGSNVGGYAIEYRVRRRIHLLKNPAFDKATISIDLYMDGDNQEKISKLNAVTYLSEGGKISELKLNLKTEVYTEKLSRNLWRKKFTLPGVKEGAIIEYEYTLTSGFLFNLRPWYFQGDVPCLWSEYRIVLPEFLNYMILQQGILPYTIATTDKKQGSYEVSFMEEGNTGKSRDDRLEFKCVFADHHWAISNVPAFQEEAYTSSSENYVNKIMFQMAGLQKSPSGNSIMSSWPEFTATLLKNLDFVNEMENTGEWWPEEMKQVLKGSLTETDIAKAIYGYVSSRYSLSGEDGDGKRNKLKKVAAAKTGTIVELNLLLTAMLRYVGLNADPVMLSTREHGFSTEAYPVIGQFNYLICRVRADEDDWLLDVTHPYLGFGKLPYKCYNGQARVLNTEATLIHLSPDQLNESDQVTAEVNFITTNGLQWNAEISHQFGFFASEELREKIRKDGLDAVRKDLTGDESSNGIITDIGAAPLETAGAALVLKYHSGNEIKNGEMIYFSPVLVPHFRQNPLKSADRKYPVEMPFKISQQYTVTIQVPGGYSIEELPSPLSIKINGKGDAEFEYTVTPGNGMISIHYSLDIAKTFFKPDEYNVLRDFFRKMTAKLEEQIVLKKK